MAPATWPRLRLRSSGAALRSGALACRPARGAWPRSLHGVLLRDRLPGAGDYPAAKPWFRSGDWISARDDLAEGATSPGSPVPTHGHHRRAAARSPSTCWPRASSSAVAPAACTLPRLSWLGVDARHGLARLHRSAACRLRPCWRLRFLCIAVFGQWDKRMLTLALDRRSACRSAWSSGLLLGIWAYRWPRVEPWLISPVARPDADDPDLRLSHPDAAAVGFGPVSAMIATRIFATPPMVRATMLGLTSVPRRSRTSPTWPAARSGRRLWRVLVPSAQADADGRRQPGHHAGAQHGHHRLDDRRGRAWLRRAAGACARSRSAQAHGGGARHRALAIVLDRLSQAFARRSRDAAHDGEGSVGAPSAICLIGAGDARRHHACGACRSRARTSCPKR